MPQFDAETKKANTKAERKTADSKIAVTEPSVTTEKIEKTEKVKEKKDDGSREAYASLSPELLAVYERLPSDNSAISIDRIARDGLSVGDVMSSLTLLELQGLVVSLPGGMYART